MKDFVTDWRGRTWRALGEVSFEIPAGTLCGIVGANGAGKSTLLRLCAGLLQPTSGTCWLGGQAPTARRRRGEIGYAPEQSNLPGAATVESVLVALAEIGGVGGRRAAREAAAGALEEVHAGELRGRRIAELSRGQRQRVALAQAVLRAPAWLLLDEPAAGLDPRAVAELGELLRAQAMRGRTVVFSSHFLPQAEAICDHFIVLDRGRVLLAAPRAAVESAGGLAEVYLGLTKP